MNLKNEIMTKPVSIQNMDDKLRWFLILAKHQETLYNKQIVMSDNYAKQMYVVIIFH
jgi:hypothetical protein